MKELRLGRLIALFAIMLLASCASLPPLKVAPGAKIAVVSFSLSNSIVYEGDKPDIGPGILNDRTAYYQPYQDAIDGGWDSFKTAAPQTFGNFPPYEFAAIEKDGELQKLTYIAPNIIMGKDISPSGTWVFPKNLNYISEYDKDRITQAGKLLASADYLMVITQEATYALTSGMRIGGLAAGSANMHVIAKVFLFKPSGEVAWNWTFDGHSSESVPFIGTGIARMQYRPLLISAEKDWMDQLKAKMQGW